MTVVLKVVFYITHTQVLLYFTNTEDSQKGKYCRFRLFVFMVYWQKS